MINYLAATLMNGVRDILDKKYIAPTGVISWVAQFENHDADRRLLGTTNPDSAKGGDGAGHSGGGLD